MTHFRPESPTASSERVGRTSDLDLSGHCGSPKAAIWRWLADYRWRPDACGCTPLRIVLALCRAEATAKSIVPQPTMKATRPFNEWIQGTWLRRPAKGGAAGEAEHPEQVS